MTPSTLALARRVRALLEAPERWTQGAYARGVTKRPVSPNGSKAVCWCLRGAMMHVEGGSGEFGHFSKTQTDLCAALHELAGRGVPSWNDLPTTTHADVLALLDRVVERMERDGERP